jgi:hypothetical protein
VSDIGVTPITSACGMKGGELARGGRLTKQESVSTASRPHRAVYRNLGGCRSLVISGI